MNLLQKANDAYAKAEKAVDDLKDKAIIIAAYSLTRDLIVLSLLIYLVCGCIDMEFIIGIFVVTGGVFWILALAWFSGFIFEKFGISK